MNIIIQQATELADNGILHCNHNVHGSVRIIKLNVKGTIALTLQKSNGYNICTVAVDTMEYLHGEQLN